jgi:hypothetical protein
MRAIKSFLVVALSTTAVLLCLAGSAMAGTITNATAEANQSGFDVTSLDVYWILDQTAGGTPVDLTTWVAPAWDSTCSQVGYPYGTEHPNGVYGMETHFGITATHTVFADGYTINPGIEYCIGMSAKSDAQFVLDAHYVSFNTPWVDTNGLPESTMTSITIPLIVYPRGLATGWSLTYFKAVNTTDCSAPDLDDLALSQTTTEEGISDDLRGTHEIYPELTGLDPESTYCVKVNDYNAAGVEDTRFWSYDTIGPAPEVTNETYTPGSGSIDFALDLDPNVGDSYSASLTFQYFKQSEGGDCSPLVDTDGYSYYDYVWLTQDSGYDPFVVSDTIPSLDAGSTYCVRAFSINKNGGSTPGSFHEVKLINKQAATAHLSVSAPSNAAHSATLNVDLNDHGAADDAGDPSSYYVDVYGIGFDRCNTEDYHGSSVVPLSTVEFEFSGSVELSYDLDGLNYNTPYCAVVHTESAWGDSYDAITYLPFKGGRAPQVLGVTSSTTTESISLTGSVDPGNFLTEYTAKYFTAAGDDACEDYTGSTSSADGNTIGENISTATNAPVTISDLDPGTTYCVRFLAGNVFGDDASEWEKIKTDSPDTTAPSVPAGLSASNVTQTSAMLSWTASTDDTAVTGYNVWKDDQAFASTLGTVTSKTVTLVCGQTSHFRVSAFDQLSHESARSAELAVTGAACDVPPTGGGGGSEQPPASKVCLAKVKTKKATLKIGDKKIKLQLKGRLMGGGQSIKLTGTGKVKQISFKVDGTSVKARKGSITLTAADRPSTVAVTFKSGKKSKTLKAKLQQLPCS